MVQNITYRMLTPPSCKICRREYFSAFKKKNFRYFMYGPLLCPKYILCPILYIHVMYFTYNTLHTHTSLNRARYSYTQLYRAIHSSTGLYTALQGYTQLYRAIQRYKQLYTAMHIYTGLYTPRQS